MDADKSRKRKSGEQVSEQATLTDEAGLITLIKSPFVTTEC